MSEVWWLRLGILIAGVCVVAAIWYFGTRPRGGQGARIGDKAGGRTEPTLSAQVQEQLAQSQVQNADVLQSESELLNRTAGSAAAQANAELGKRASEDFDKIITLYIAARAGQTLRGPDIVVAAEKAGLAFGHMNVFHRLVQGHPERGPVFSVANVQQPGSFEMAQIQSLQTPAIAFFLTLPAPVPSLDAWDMMQPTAQRMAELLDGVVLDEERNALGRQRIQHIRESLRAYDRQTQAPVTPARAPRW